MSTYVGDVFMPWPMLRVSGYINVASASATVDADTEKIACIFQAPKDGSIEYVGLGIGTITSTPGANVDIRIETVSTSTGNPTGTLFGSNTNYSWDMSGATANFLNKIGPLTSNASVSRGDYLAVVYVPPSSPNQGNVNFSGWQDETLGFPYSLFYNGGSWTTTTNRLKGVLYYTDGFAYMPTHYASSALNNLVLNSGDTYNHVGMKMKSRVALSVSGMFAHLNLAEDAKLKIISGTDTLIGQIQLTTEYRASSAQYTHYGYFDSPKTLSADTDYRFVVAPDTVTDVTIFGGRMGDTSDTSQILFEGSHMSNPFYNIVAEEGELSTPAWQSITGAGANAWYHIGPIVRSIG